MLSSLAIWLPNSKIVQIKDEIMKRNLLDYNFPEDLKAMSIEEMELLSYSIREFLIDKSDVI